jgi:two-component system CheB/CheR fusion protein
MTTRPAWRKRPTNELEDQLRETLQRYELIFKATNDVLYDLDLSNGTIIWNEALYTQYGYDRGEEINHLEWWAEHVHPDDALRLEDEMSRWFEGLEDTWQAEYRFRTADDSYVFVKDRGAVHRAPDGSPIRIIGSFLDITRQKQLANAKDEFISLVSHQLRTPLTAIRVYSEMLTADMFGQLHNDQKAPVQHITDASVRLIKLVDNILNISRVELGHVISVPLLKNVNEFLQAQIDEVQPLAIEKGVTIHFQPDTKIKKIPIDTTIFGQVVHNLLTNAVHYTKAQEGIIDVTFKPNSDGYLLTVHDNGIGIPKSAQPYVFNRFYRADNARNLKEHGTGLGLYLIKLMTETTGCSVWFESQKNKGTTFYIQVPPEGMRAG